MTDTPHFQDFDDTDEQPWIQPVERFDGTAEEENLTGTIRLGKALSDGLRATTTSLKANLLPGVVGLIIVALISAAFIGTVVHVMRQAVSKDNTAETVADLLAMVVPTMLILIPLAIVASITLNIVFTLTSWASVSRGLHTPHAQPHSVTRQEVWSSGIPKGALLGSILLATIASSVVWGTYQAIGAFAANHDSSLPEHVKNDSNSGLAMSLGMLAVMLVIMVVAQMVSTAISFTPYTVCHLEGFSFKAGLDTIKLCLKPNNLIALVLLFFVTIGLGLVVIATMGLGAIFITPWFYNILASVYYNDLRPSVENAEAIRQDLAAERA